MNGRVVGVVLLLVFGGCISDEPQPPGLRPATVVPNVGGAGVPAAGAAGMVPAAGAPATSGDTCAAATPGVAPTMLHMEAQQVLTGATTCAAGSGCHAPPSNKAGLNLKGMTDLRAVLVGKPACQTTLVPLIDGTGGDAALANSWIWLKLTAPVNGSGVIKANMAWGAPVPSCGQDATDPFGTRMPKSFSDMLFPDAPRAKIRDWICAGAPGP